MCSQSSDGEVVVKFKLTCPEARKGCNGAVNPDNGEPDVLRLAFKLHLQALRNNRVAARFKLALEPTVEGSCQKVDDDGEIVPVEFDEEWTPIAPSEFGCVIPNLQLITPDASVLLSQWDDSVQYKDQPVRVSVTEPEKREKDRFGKVLEEVCVKENFATTALLAQSAQTAENAGTGQRNLRSGNKPS